MDDRGIADSDIMVIEQVAELLHCSVDTVRRIPKSELPAYAGPGRKHLYLRSDIIDYLRRRPVVHHDVDGLLAEIDEIRDRRAQVRLLR